MNSVLEKKHINRLNEKNIVIEEEFYRNYNDKKDIIGYRTSDGTKNDKIYNSVRVYKRFYKDGKCLREEKKYSKDILYSFIAGNENGELKCPNCGYISNSHDFYDGCPYCGTNFNIDYSVKSFGTTGVEMKKLFKNWKFTLIILAVSVLLTMLTCVFYTYIFDLASKLGKTYEDFNFEDAIPGFFLIYLFITYIAWLLIIIPKTIKYRSIQVENQELCNIINAELIDYYYNKNNEKYKDLIDFEIAEYKKILFHPYAEKPYISTKVKIRKFFFKNDKIHKKENYCNINLSINFDEKEKDKKVNIVMCENCGASLDLSEKVCKYCGTILPIKRKYSIIKLSNA